MITVLAAPPEQEVLAAAHLPNRIVTCQFANLLARYYMHVTWHIVLPILKSRIIMKPPPIDRRHFLAISSLSFLSLFIGKHAMANHEPISPLKLSDAQWKEKLSPKAYDVLRKEGTEPAFTSALNNEKRDGIFACAGCDFKLIWPRTEYHCARCGGHQGHVFKDGPKPTGLRYCNNGVALIFIPKES